MAYTTALNRVSACFIALVCFFGIAACEGGDDPQFRELAKALEHPWPGSTPAEMTMAVRSSGGHLVLHCVVHNSSWPALQINRSVLPWVTPIFFTGTILNSRGGRFPVGPLGPGSYLIAEAEPISVAPNGDIEISQLPKIPIIGPKPRKNEAAMLLWSYNLLVYPDAPPQGSSAKAPAFKTVRVSGVTYMPAEAIDLLAN